MQKLRVCNKEGVSPEQVFFAFLCFWLSKHKFFVRKGQLMKIQGFIFSGNQEKNHV